MSQMSLVEKRARQSFAISLLNKIRHWLQDRQGIKLLEKDLIILKQSIEFYNFNESEKLKISELATLYNLQGRRDKEKAASLSIAQVIHQELENDANNNILEKLQLFVNNPDEIKKSEENKKILIEFFKKAINLTALQIDKTSSQIISKGL